MGWRGCEMTRSGMKVRVQICGVITDRSRGLL